MVALDADGRPDFSLLQEMAGMRGLGVKRGERVPLAEHQPADDDGPDRPAGLLVYHAFDLLHLDSWDLLDVPLEERKRLLRLVLREHPSVRFVSHVLELWRGLPAGRHRTGPGGQRRQGAPQPVRTRQALAGLAEDQGATGTGAGPRRL